ncbi:MAG TPA: JAB domain-containing protein [Dehalococcoidia bacterium]|nr:JAB domain-containing protein [Dehalococcoidia bacterium]
MPAEDIHKGHRRRLREKFLKSGLAGFHDYEIVELLLTLGAPRKDCKPQAKEAIRRFKNLRGVLAASLEELQQIKGIGPHSAFGIKLMQEVAREFLKEKIMEKPFCKSSREIFDYLYHAMRDRKKELFKVIYLNSQNQIIETADLFEGTVNSSAVSLREVVEGALKHNAVSLIFVHNHPSGNPEPSASDRELTRELVYAGEIMRIKVLDHIIIGDNRYFSFADGGLIEEYETDFLNLKLRGTSEAKRRLYQARLSSGKL